MKFIHFYFVIYSVGGERKEKIERRREGKERARGHQEFDSCGYGGLLSPVSDGTGWENGDSRRV